MSSSRKRILDGSVLAYVLVIMTVVSILLVSMLTFISSQIKNGAYAVGREQAFQAAEQGIQFYKWYLAHQTDGRSAAQVETFWNSGSPFGIGSDYVVSVSDPSGGVMGTFTLRVTPPEPGSTIAVVESTGESARFPGKTRTIRVRFRRPSWSESAVLADHFVRFGDGTEVFGKIHVNDGLRFDGFVHNVVTSSVESVNELDHSGNAEFGVHTHVNRPPSTGVNDSFRPLEAPPNTVSERSDVFGAGREFPISVVDFDGVSSELGYMKTEAQSGHGIYFNSAENGRRIILRTDGTFDECRVRTYNTSTFMPTNYARNTGSGTCTSCGGNNCTRNHPIPDGGIIFVEDHVWISGQINGQKITVVAADFAGTGSERSIFIPNDLRYTNYDGSDIIGIMAQKDVEIPRDSEDNLRIDAALLAQLGRVGRSDYGNSKSTITVFGAIATYSRYGFAYTDGTGYHDRNLYYDNNLLYYPPPYFPTGTQYHIDLWEEL
ncbi:MAG: hypothetical protein HGB34_02440 [Candidatus Moranbacteria bacterium]|nr:hypothetical protein [Candidatus Moranbacteria bacterium]NTW75737.1 hypothetical protein [Candidatus Moranbacteria bacterium]